MITGVQPKILLTQTEDGNLKMDDEMGKLLFGDPKMNWELVRERDGLKIFGSPHTPQFGQWAFMKARHKLDRVWSMAIDDDVDIIITHGPPKGILDLSEDRNGCLEYCGDKSLLNRVEEVKPKLVLFGHIHNAKNIVNTGIRKIYGLETLFSNATTVTDGKRGKLTSNGNVIEI